MGLSGKATSDSSIVSVLSSLSVSTLALGELSSELTRGGGRGKLADLDDVISPFASDGDEDFTRTDTDPGFRGLGGGVGRASSCLSRGDESFFSTGGLGPFAKGISSPKGVLPSDLDLRCMGRGGAGGFISAPARLGAGGTGGVRRFAASGGRLLTSGGDCLVEVAPGSSNLGLAGNGGRGTSIPNRFSRLTEEQRTGGIGGGDSDPVLAPSDVLFLGP